MLVFVEFGYYLFGYGDFGGGLVGLLDGGAEPQGVYSGWLARF